MIEYLAETLSTNVDAAERLRGGGYIPDGAWLVADRQLAGRGRHGRAWFDGTGNFMGSTVVTLRFGDPPPPTLSLVAGLAVQRTVETLIEGKARAMLKWPNDLVVGTAKLAGILLERENTSVIIGIGVNLALAPQVEGRETVSLAALGVNVHRDSFASDLAAAFSQELERWRTYGIEPVIRRWLATAHAVGTGLQTTDAAGKPLSGTFAGLSPDGALQLRLANGTTQTLQSGEVHFTQS